MARRVLSPDEAAAIGLPAAPAQAEPSAPGRRVLSPEEVPSELKRHPLDPGTGQLKSPLFSPEDIQAAGLTTIGEQNDPGFWSTLGHNFLQGYSKEGGDELVGKITEAITKDPASYRPGRDKERNTLEWSETRRPILSGGARLAGDVASDLTLQALGVPVLGRTYQTIAGAGRGFLGNDHADLSDGATLGEKLSSGVTTTIGGAVGNLAPLVPKIPGAAGGAIRKLGQKIEQTGPGGRIAASDFAKYFTEATDAAGKKIGDAAAAVGGALTKAARWPGEVLERGGVAMGRRAMSGAKGLKAEEALSDAAVRTAMDEGALLPLGTTKGAAKRLAAVRERLGTEHARIVEALKTKGVHGPEAQALADTWLEKALKKDANSLGSSVPDLYLDRADEVLKKAGPDGRLALDQSIDITRDLQGQAKYGKFEETLVNRAKRDVASDVRRAVEGEVDAAAAKSADPELGRLATEFRPLKRKLGAIIEASDHAREEASRQSSRSLLNPFDLVAAGSTGTFTGNPMKAAAAYVGAHLLRSRGPSTAALTGRGLGNAYLKVIDEAPWVLGEFGSAIAREKTPEARMAMTEALRMQYPQFAEMFEELRQRLANDDRPFEPEASRAP